MTVTEALIGELRREADTTRRVLARVPDAKLAWKPHEKSMSLGQLAFHIARLPRGITELITELSAEVPNVSLPGDLRVSGVLQTLDESVEYAAQKLSGWGEVGLSAMWRMTRDGKTLLELPRLDMVRSVMLNHWYHHRGQLTVYLRLLDVPLPAVYGPSADDEIFG